VGRIPQSKAGLVVARGLPAVKKQSGITDPTFPSTAASLWTGRLRADCATNDGDPSRKAAFVVQ
jgi:hypothetical protein